MQKPPTSDLALLLIEENKRTKDPYLDLGRCGLTHLPEELGDCVWVETLVLSSEWKEYDLEKNGGQYFSSKNKGEPNRIISIAGVEKLPKLIKLIVAMYFSDENKNWPLSNLEPLKAMTQLQYLNCSYTQVENLNPLKDMAQLQYLDCSHTLVTDFSPLKGMVQIQCLDCRNTKVADFSPLKGMAQLQYLDCSHTLVESIEPLKDISQLQYLDCSFTQVESIEPLKDISQLQYLDCSHTLVKKLSPLANLPKLDYFNFNYCPISDCPADVYQSNDNKKLRAFFKREQTEKQPANYQRLPERDNRTHDVKLILLGNSDAGKTSLLHYLQTGQFLTQRNSTHGLEVHRWLPDAKRFPLLSDVAVSIWDFGGQEYYHGAYRLFMSANAAYLLLWDSATNCNGRRPTCLKSDEPEVALEHFEVRYWLDTVRHYGGEVGRSPLLAVQNKTDLPTGKQRLSQALHEQYSINESFHLSLKCGCDQNKYPRDGHALRHFDAELEHVLLSMMDKKGLPNAWMRIRVSILELQDGKNKRRNPFRKKLKGDGSIPLADFESACQELLGEPLNENEGTTIAATLHRGGVVVYFEESETLYDRVFLKPAELAERIYEVLKKQVLELGGEFTLDEVFDKKKNDGFQNVFIEATQSLGLVFPHPTKQGAFIAPQYLPDEHPIEDLYKIASHGTWQSAYWVKVPLFYYKKLLHSLVLHFASDSTEARYFWKHGIFFLKNGLRVLVKGLYPAENESEGILHIGVESSPMEVHSILQKEIFEEILLLLFSRNERKKSLHNDEKRKKTKIPFVLPALELPEYVYTAIERLQIMWMEFPDWLEVSTDGEYFVKYNQLKEKAAANEIRIEAIKKSGEKQQVLIRTFEPLLDRPPKRAKRVFFSYSHSDTLWLKRLRNHLSGLRRSNDIETWDDQEILPGDQWDKSIKDKLADADVFILLLSADFIASNYIWEVELKSAFKSFQEKGKTVIPILAEPIDLGGLPGVDELGTTIQSFEIVPKNQDERLLAISLWGNQEEALAKVAERIRMAVRGGTL